MLDRSRAQIHFFLVQNQHEFYIWYMPRRNLLFVFIAIAIVITLGFLLVGKNSLNEKHQVPVAVNNPAAGHEETRQHSASTHFSNEIINKSPSNKNTSDELSATILLTSGNFESFILKCFQGEKCKLGDSPSKMYQDFKSANNHGANDNLISFMRSQLREKEFRDQYKDSLKQMIDDFYPEEEKQFQEAAYYNYLGDLQKSLDLYLDLQEKEKNDPSLRGAPNLNIANTLYDMTRIKEALPYYEAALKDYLSGRVKADPSPVSFIEDRIMQIKNKLQP